MKYKIIKENFQKAMNEQDETFLDPVPRAVAGEIEGGLEYLIGRLEKLSAGSRNKVIKALGGHTDAEKHEAYLRGQRTCGETMNEQGPFGDIGRKIADTIAKGPAIDTKANDLAQGLKDTRTLDQKTMVEEIMKFALARYQKQLAEQLSEASPEQIETLYRNIEAARRMLPGGRP